jgi:conjugal transfer ATP-binding protein TraC
MSKIPLTDPLKDLASLPTKIWESVFKRYKLSKFLPYHIYDDAKEIYINNDNTYGVVYQCVPRIRMGTSPATAIEEMLNKLPDNTFIQFTLVGSTHITYLN